VPKVVRRRRNWPAGRKLVVEEVADGLLLRRAPLFERTQISDVFGMLKTVEPARAVEEIDAAVVEKGRRQDAGN